MLRHGPTKREAIQDAFRYFKQHQGLPHDQVRMTLLRLSLGVWNVTSPIPYF